MPYLPCWLERADGMEACATGRWREGKGVAGEGMAGNQRSVTEGCSGSEAASCGLN